MIHASFTGIKLNSKLLLILVDKNSICKTKDQFCHFK